MRRAGAPEPIAFALRGRGVTELYGHQARALAAVISHARAGRDADRQRQSYCFHLPVVSMLEDRDARASTSIRRSARARPGGRLTESFTLERARGGRTSVTRRDARRAAKADGDRPHEPAPLHAESPHHTGRGVPEPGSSSSTIQYKASSARTRTCCIVDARRRFMARSPSHRRLYKSPTRETRHHLRRRAESSDELVSITESGAAGRRVFLSIPPWSTPSSGSAPAT
jgi:hypothetical protein